MVKLFSEKRLRFIDKHLKDYSELHSLLSFRLLLPSKVPRPYSGEVHWGPAVHRGFKVIKMIEEQDDEGVAGKRDHPGHFLKWKDGFVTLFTKTEKYKNPNVLNCIYEHNFQSIGLTHYLYPLPHILP